MGNDRNIPKRELLTREQEISLAKRIEAGDEKAVNQMVEANLGLVHFVVRKYVGRGLEYDDLFQVGCMGLMTAARRFDWKRENKFSTVAFWWIRQSIQRSIDDYGTCIRIPSFMRLELLKMERIASSLRQKLGRKPQTQEIAEAMGVEMLRIKELLQIASTQPSSLNVYIGEDGETELLDLVPCDSDLQMVRHTESRQFKEIIDELLISWLTEEEETVLRLRFGIGSRKQYTLEGVSKKMGIPLEKVRQVEDQALRKLKPRAHAKQLEVFLR